MQAHIHDVARNNRLLQQLIQREQRGLLDPADLLAFWTCCDELALINSVQRDGSPASHQCVRMRWRSGASHPTGNVIDLQSPSRLDSDCSGSRPRRYASHYRLVPHQFDRIRRVVDAHLLPNGRVAILQARHEALGILEGH